MVAIIYSIFTYVFEVSSHLFFFFLVMLYFNKNY